MRRPIWVVARQVCTQGARRRRRPRPLIGTTTELSPRSVASCRMGWPEVSLLVRTFSSEKIETEMMTRLAVSGETSSSESVSTVSTVPDLRRHAKTSIEKLSRSDNPNAAEQAEEIIRDLEARDVHLPSDDYDKVIRCYIHHDQVERAHSLLLTGKQIRPSVRGFSLVANAWISRNRLCKARELLDVYMERGIAVTMCFNTVIAALVKHNKRVVNLLHSMDDYARNGHPEARPDKVTMSCVLQFMARRGDAQDAQALLERMWTSPDADMHPDAITYSLIFTAYANARHCMPDRAWALLKTMKDRYTERGKMSIKPNIVVYNSFLSVLAKAGDGEHAERVLNELVAAKDLQPDYVTYGTVLTAWKNASRGDKAEALLRRIPDPDRMCFSITIAALAAQGHAQRAEEIFQLMLSRNLKPTTAIYTALLNGWANCRDDPASFEHVKRILHEMMKRDDVDLDTPVWNTFLKAIEHAPGLDNKTHAVGSVLQRMRQLGPKCRPSSVTYRHAIHAVGATIGDTDVQKEALRLAMRIYQCRTDLPHRQQGYMKLHTAMLEVCGKLSPRGINGDEIVEQVFATCCREGVVSSLHTTLLRKAASDELLKKIFKTEMIPHELHSYPKSWSRNRKGQRRKRSEGQR